MDAKFIEDVLQREQVTDHDVAAFVDVMQSRIGGSASSWIHYGLTSSDIVDTAWCWMLRDAADLLIDASTKLLRVVTNLAKAHRDTVMIGRTHGVHAEPTTFGAKVALWALQIDRDRSRLQAARDNIAVCKLSGAVGTYSNIDPRVEQSVATALGLRAVPATQVISRDRHAEYMWACAAVGNTCEMIAVELRHLQRTEVREVEEGFKVGQKVHLRCPINAIRFLRKPSLVCRGYCAEIFRPLCKMWRCGTSETFRIVQLSESCFLIRQCLRTMSYIAFDDFLKA